MAGRFRDTRGLPAAAVAVLLVTLTVTVTVLAVLAVQRGKGIDPTGSPRPVPTFSYGAPTQTPTASAVTITAPGPAERFLAVGDGVIWRASAGACGATPPTVELSNDEGISWRDVTPTYRDITQVRDLIVFAQTEADLVADMGADCETQALRTFTQGTFWSPYDELLPRSTFLDAATVSDDGDTYDAPCGDGWSLRTAASLTAVICDGTGYARLDGQWSTIGDNLVALDVYDDQIVGAMISADCDGLAVTRLGADSEQLACADGLDPESPAALDVTDKATYLWSGDEIIAIER